MPGSRTTCESVSVLIPLTLLGMAGLAVLHSTAEAAQVSQVRGRCEVRRGNGAWQRLSPRAVVDPGDSVRTGAGSSLSLDFAGAARASLGPQSQAVVTDTGIAQGGVRRLAALARGTARVWAKKLLGAGAKLEVSTPTAAAAVRGTRFFLVANDASTTVGVSEGSVEVSSTGAQGPAVIVNAGQKTVVNAGELPLPPSPLTGGEAREARGETAALDRIEDVAVEETEQVALERYIAFSDVLLDTVRNPAYAAQTVQETAQVFGQAQVASHEQLKPAPGFAMVGGAVTAVQQQREQSSNGGSVWTTALQPLAPGEVWGVFGSYQRDHQWETSLFTGTATVNGAATPFTQHGTPATLDASTRFEAYDLGLVRARSYATFDAGVLVHYRESSSSARTRYDRTATGLALDSDWADSTGSSDLKQVVAGIASTTQSGVNWGASLGYRNGRIDQRDLWRLVDGAAGPLFQVAEPFTGWDVELRARKRLTDTWGWGASLRSIFLDGTPRYTDKTGVSFTEDLRDKFYRLGFGVAYTPSPQTAAGLDLVLGLRRENVSLHYLSGNLKGTEHEDDPSWALHLGGQHWLTDDSFLFGEFVHLRQRIHKDFVLYPDVPGAASNAAQYDRITSALTEWSLGYGRRLSGGSWVEYMLTDPLTTGQGLRHNVLVSWRR